FPDDEITALLGRIAAGLAPAGLLFLGYSESLSWLKTPFERIRLGDTFVYRVAQAAGGNGGVPAPSARPARPARPKRERSRPSAPESKPDSEGAERFLFEGQEALGTGDSARAVTAFRKAAYLRPGDTTVSLHLAFALDALGDADAARRWFRLAYEAILASDDARPVLEGWSTDELIRLLERKLQTQGNDE
ncbi:MAG TPA: hypothetical protein VFF24_06610, partial [Acidimicrobiia bacterium]|nr:hypothetical protein [Acidimicrobiia bacterium]